MSSIENLSRYSEEDRPSSSSSTTSRSTSTSESEYPKIDLYVDCNFRHIGYSVFDFLNTPMCGLFWRQQDMKEMKEQPTERVAAMFVRIIK